MDDEEDKPNTGIGADVGNSVLPGVSATEHIRLKADAKFKGFPRIGANGSRYDTETIKADYMNTPIVEWDAFCALRGYNPRVYTFAWKSWVREKKYRNSWEKVREQIEDEGLALGPRTLLAQVRAIRTIPETAAAMLNLLQHSIRIHMDEAKHDEAQLKQHRDAGTVMPWKEQKFSLNVQSAMFLSSALKQTSELLYKSLGVDSSVGMNPTKWLDMVQSEVGKVDGTQEILAESQDSNPVRVQLMGGEDLQTVLAKAVECWMDKPGGDESLASSAAPEDLLPKEGDDNPTEADDAQSDD